MMRKLILVLGIAIGLTACMDIDLDGEGPGSRPIVRDDCHVGGCSSQVCSDRPDVVTTCEWREEYACYRTAICARQPAGDCDWTPTDELETCIADAR